VRIAVIGPDILTAIFGSDQGWSGEMKEWIAQGVKPGQGLLLRYIFNLYLSISSTDK
jgi:hypothetical protein